MFQTVESISTLQVINSSEDKPVEEWEHLYPEQWLLLEVTESDDEEPKRARLVAVAKEDIELLDLWRERGSQGIPSLVIRGVSQEPGPTVIAYA